MRVVVNVELNFLRYGIAPQQRRYLQRPVDTRPYTARDNERAIYYHPLRAHRGTVVR
jgi:hypothetical protein